MKIAVVASMFNEDISNNLIWGATQCYKDIYKKDIDKSYIFRVNWEIALPLLI